jgi:hypothetical protein
MNGTVLIEKKKVMTLQELQYKILNCYKKRTKICPRCYVNEDCVGGYKNKKVIIIGLNPHIKDKNKSLWKKLLNLDNSVKIKLCNDLLNVKCKTFEFMHNHGRKYSIGPIKITGNEIKVDYIRKNKKNKSLVIKGIKLNPIASFRSIFEEYYKNACRLDKNQYYYSIARRFKNIAPRRLNEAQIFEKISNAAAFIELYKYPTKDKKELKKAIKDHEGISDCPNKWLIKQIKKIDNPTIVLAGNDIQKYWDAWEKKPSLKITPIGIPHFSNAANGAWNKNKKKYKQDLKRIWKICNGG